MRASRASRVHAFWIVLDTSDPASPATVALPDGREALVVFSSEEEARMFCRVGMEWSNPHVRETSPSEILSLLSCYPSVAKRVILDPIPEFLGGRLSELLTLDGERFARSFARPGSEPVVRTPYV